MVLMIFVFHDVQTIPNGRDESSNHGFRDRNMPDSFSGFVANSIQGGVRPGFSALREWAVVSLFAHGTPRGQQASIIMTLKGGFRTQLVNSGIFRKGISALETRLNVDQQAYINWTSKLTTGNSKANVTIRNP
jgi:hypothetical protein